MDCIFCKIISKQIPAKILNETSHSICFLDAFPLTNGHVLVIPKNHHKKIVFTNGCYDILHLGHIDYLWA